MVVAEDLKIPIVDFLDSLPDSFRCFSVVETLEFLIPLSLGDEIGVDASKIGEEIEAVIASQVVQVGVKSFQLGKRNEKK